MLISPLLFVGFVVWNCAWYYFVPPGSIPIRDYPMLSVAISLFSGLINGLFVAYFMIDFIFGSGLDWVNPRGRKALKKSRQLLLSALTPEQKKSFWIWGGF